MKVDLGFWNNKGEYVEDIQELNEIERKEVMENKMQRSFEILEELNSMTENFLEYSEEMNQKQEKQCKECICESCKTVANVVVESKKLRDENAELKAENERLKEEVETRDNFSETFRKEALNWANIANEYQKDKTKLEQTLQEIKEIAENAYCLTNYTNKDMANFAKQVLNLITKAEEE